MKKLSRGMVKDTSRVDQPEGTMRDALNANLNVAKGSVVNEYGTTAFNNMIDFQVFGNVTLEDDNIIVFGRTVGDVAIDQIRHLATSTGVVTVLYETNDLNFKPSHPIVSIARKNQAGEHLVYFTDGYRKEEIAYPGFKYVKESNPPRVLNVTKQFDFRALGFGADMLYNPSNTFHKLELVARVGQHSDIATANILTGGSLVSGAYYLAIAYADGDGLETNYFSVSNPVYIVPGEESAVPSNTLIGAEGGTSTNKSIVWGLDTPARS